MHQQHVCSLVSWNSRPWMVSSEIKVNLQLHSSHSKLFSVWILVCSISWVKLSKISPHLLQLHLASNGRWFLSWILWCLKSSSTVKNESFYFLHLYLSRLLCSFLRCLKLSICVPNCSVQLSSLQWYCGNLLTLWTSFTCSSMLLTLRNFL